MILNAERRNSVHLAISELHPAERQAVRIVVLDGRSLRKVCSSLGVSAIAIKRRVKSGHNQLESKLSSLNSAG